MTATRPLIVWLALLQFTASGATVGVATAIARGKDNTVGNALIEVYRLALTPVRTPLRTAATLRTSL